MDDGGHLTIEETARRLGRPASWFKEQICEGRLGATLSGRKWLIPPQEYDRLLQANSPSRVSEQPVHDFLDQSARPHTARKRSDVSSSIQRNGPNDRSRKSLPSGSRRPDKSNQAGSNLIRKIKEMDRNFERQTVRLRAAMLEYRAAEKTGKKRKPPRSLVQRWKEAKAELRYLIANAEAKGLALPPGLTITRILAKEAETAKRKTASGTDVEPKRKASTSGGIGGYSAGTVRPREQDSQRMPAEVEARLTILRSRERNAAHAMRDRGKDRAARSAAEIRWAEARREAARLEREFGPVRRPD